ncbi:MAG TPA: type I-D CRISPR-associated protein Cas10d/Csc3 [Cyanobacteria bacterium UBA8803]|nr:type I-D CRISPR-associated protein Cas10d/Csc3 [Cyanobacteria bacterium UBA9273]HBL58581.1 type I-D CRISPR-associated protein Cas10d/Csc3 [Cyanobacteria bacterium UBA8803]
MADFSSILQDFVGSIVPRLRTALRFHRKLAKGGTQPDGTPYVNKRTGEPYMATTQLTHVLVGLSALCRLLIYLQERNLLPQPVTDSDFRRVCALFCLHDLHKDEDIQREVKRVETSIDPSEMLVIAEQVGLTDWLGLDELNGYEYREAMVHLSDTFHGYRKHCRGEIGYERLYVLVRLADAMASIQSLEEGSTGLHNRLAQDFARSLKSLKFYYHKITDYRGLTTNLYHQAIARTLQRKYGLYPLLFFENGTLYIGQEKPQPFHADDFLDLVVSEFINSLQNLGENTEIAPDYNYQTQRFEKYVFSFSSLAKLLKFLQINSQRKVKAGWFKAYLEKRFEQEYFQVAFESTDQFYHQFSLNINRDSDANFASKWDAVSRYLGGVLNLLRDIYLAPDPNWQTVITWLGNHLGIPTPLQKLIAQQSAIFNNAGTPKFSHILAYHYLEQFNYEGNTVSTTPVDVILDTINLKLLPNLRDLDSPEKRQNYVEDELALKADTVAFLKESLIWSWNSQVVNSLAEPLGIVAVKKKTGSHKNLCSLCNRIIPKQMKASTIKADILEDTLKEFSNRLLPKVNVASRLWCPQCYLEWMVRKLAGIGYAPGAKHDNSERLYFFIMPNPVLTPEMLDVLRNRLKPLRDSTAVRVRQYGKGTHSIPKVWLHSRSLTEAGQGQDWLETVIAVLSEEATRQAELIAKNGKRSAGDRIVSFGIFDDEDWDDTDSNIEEESSCFNPLPSNFLLVTLEASAYNKDKSIKHTELWLRGLLTALVLQDLLGMRVYLTDKPYLPVAYLEQVTAALELDGEHPSLRSLFTSNPQLLSVAASNQLRLRGIPVDEILDRLCALWVVNESLSDKDSNIARCLAEVNHNELAGARFFADYQRSENSKALPPLLLEACRILLNSLENLEGNTSTMSLKNLAEVIAEQSLDLFLPSTPKDGKGKSHRYETVYRTAIAALKKVARNSEMNIEEIIGHIAGTLTKRLERLDTGVVVPYQDQEKNELARKFAQTIAVDLFEQRCGKSFSRLSRYENDLANAVFFYVSENIDARWKRWHELKAQRQNLKEHSAQAKG